MKLSRSWIAVDANPLGSWRMRFRVKRTLAVARAPGRNKCSGLSANMYVPYLASGWASLK